ncbi:OmpA family protein [Frankia sp. R82]|uniref:OmpA family protein n=1 Tax=Frankia sp. R82 TaxID=2950553 RepID=UPI002042C9BE|nr:OmpA family protein [Frankia sp. R82]MCM3882304.1 OmpA family protein [Frankia sp. R82]
MAVDSHGLAVGRRAVRRTPGRLPRTVVGVAAALVLMSAGCTGAASVGGAPPATRPTTSAASAVPGDRSATGSPDVPASTGARDLSVSSGVQVTARDLRLVRLGRSDLALQFEFANAGPADLRPADLGLDPLTHVIAFLVDLPRGTGYATQRTPQASPDIDLSAPGEARVSASAEHDVAPGHSATVTLVFPAPPAAARSMLVLVDGFVPVEVPIQAEGAPALRDDPVLHVASSPPDELDPPVAPLVCPTEATPAAGRPARASFRLPSDVLFDFGSAIPTAAAAKAIDALASQLTVTGGTVTVAGHTDSVGGDADNQRLSEARAATVQQALAARLGATFTYRTVGFGAADPVAPNTRPDGSDDPDGRARNRRVELTVDPEPDASGQPPPTSEAPNTALDGSPLVPAVRSVSGLAGFTLAEVAIHNSGSTDRELGYLNNPSRTSPDGIRADTGGELSLVSSTGGRLRPCVFTPSWWGLLANGTGADTVPAGGTLVQWALFAALPADQRAVDVVVGGYRAALSARIAS